MPKYQFNVAMSIRAYGTVSIDGDSPEDAKSKLTADYVADNFEPHGGGDDDLDYQYPSDISMDGSCWEGDDCDNKHELEPFEISDGNWINDPLGKAAPDMLAALKAVGEWTDLIEQNYPEMLFTKQVRAAIAKAEGGAA